MKFLLAAVFLVTLAEGEMFTALVHMEGLVELEEELSNQLRQYIEMEKTRLAELER
jgi:prolyl 4-hydroxylase